MGSQNPNDKKFWISFSLLMSIKSNVTEFSLLDVGNPAAPAVGGSAILSLPKFQASEFWIMWILSFGFWVPNIEPRDSDVFSISQHKKASKQSEAIIVTEPNFSKFPEKIDDGIGYIKGYTEVCKSIPSI